MMPADASGVTTDDHGRPLTGGGEPAVAEGVDDGGGEAGDGPPGTAAGAHEGDAIEGDGGDPGLSDPAGAAGGPAAGGPAAGGPAGAGFDDGGPDETSVLDATGEPTAQVDPAREPTALVGATGEPTAQFDDPTLPAPAVPPPSGLPPGAEPPPAPVLVPPGRQPGRSRRAAGRHLARRRARASRRGLRVNQRLWTIDPWSVFKVSALFYLCLGLIIVVAGTLLYNAGRSVGTVDQLESFVTRMGAYGECVARSEVPEGAEFREDEDTCGDGEVLVGGFTLDDGTLFRAAAGAVGVLVVTGAIGNVLLVVLLNLLNELTGGLRHTVIKEPVSRPAPGGSPRPGGPPVRQEPRSPGRPPER